MTKLNHEVIDKSGAIFDPNDDYTDYAISVAENVRREPDSKGIVICGSGVGVTIAANKIKEARCCLGFTPNQVKNGREDEDLNILALASDYTDEDKAQELITSFLKTPFLNIERHVRRLEKIAKYD